VLIALHALVLMLGGAYTYARVPLGFWLQGLFELERNPYDRIGPCEVLLRGRYVSGPRMAAFLSGCVALAVSAFYELVEWWATGPGRRRVPRHPG
jgi:putative membrane protein